MIKMALNGISLSSPSILLVQRSHELVQIAIDALVDLYEPFARVAVPVFERPCWGSVKV